MAVVSSSTSSISSTSTVYSVDCGADIECHGCREVFTYRGYSEAADDELCHTCKAHAAIAALQQRQLAEALEQLQMEKTRRMVAEEKLKERKKEMKKMKLEMAALKKKDQEYTQLLKKMNELAVQADKTSAVSSA